MDVHDKIDEAVLLSKIHRPATTSDATRGYMGAETLRHRNEPRSADIYVKAPLNNDVEKQSLLRKLQTAMKVNLIVCNMTYECIMINKLPCMHAIHTYIHVHMQYIYNAYIRLPRRLPARICGSTF